MRLKYEAKNAWEFERENNKLDDVMNYSKGYMHFLDVGKTERTSAREIVRMAKENGYISITPVHINMTETNRINELKALGIEQ